MYLGRGHYMFVVSVMVTLVLYQVVRLNPLKLDWGTQAACMLPLKGECVKDVVVFAEARVLVKLLLGAGANPTAMDTQRGQTALHAAAIANDLQMVKVSEDDVAYNFQLHDT